MAGNLSNYAEGKILEHSVGRTEWAKPTVRVGLFLTLPTDTTEASGGSYAGEVSGGNYSRVATTNLTWGAANSTGASTTVSNVLAITFPTSSASWGEIVGVGLFDADTGGNLIWWGPLTAPKTVGNGEVFQFGIGALSLSLD